MKFLEILQNFFQMVVNYKEVTLIVMSTLLFVAYRIRTNKKIPKNFDQIILQRLNNSDLHFTEIIKELSEETKIQCVPNHFNIKEGLELIIFVGEHNEREYRFLKTVQGWSNITPPLLDRYQ